MQRCDDDRVCCYRKSENSECDSLYNTYHKNGKCPFCKEHEDDIGMSENMSIAKLLELEKEIKKKVTAWKKKKEEIE